jgi:hypothetical protein
MTIRAVILKLILGVAVTVSLTAENDPAAKPYPLAVSAGFSAGLSVGRLLGLSLGGTARFYWRPLDVLFLELSVAARTLIGHELSIQAAVLTPLIRSGSWSLEIGAGLGLSYESRLATYTQNDPVPTGGVYGPFWAVTVLATLAPLHFSGGRVDVSLLRLGLGAEGGAWLFAPLFSVDVIEIIVNLGE